MFKRRKILVGFAVRANFAVRVQKRLPVVDLPLHPSVGPNVVSIWNIGIILPDAGVLFQSNKPQISFLLYFLEDQYKWAHNLRRSYSQTRNQQIIVYL